LAFWHCFEELLAADGRRDDGIVEHTKLEQALPQVTRSFFLQQETSC
jgi:hypothetical protein